MKISIVLIIVIFFVLFVNSSAEAIKIGSSYDSVQNRFVANNGTSSPNYGGYTNPSAAYYNGSTYIVWQGGYNGSLTPYIIKYTQSTDSFTQPVQIDTAILSSDDHGAPSIIISNNGIIHVFYGAHLSQVHHAKSVTAENITTWNTGTILNGTSLTYPSPIMISNGDIYLFYRQGSSNTTFIITTDNGTTWNSPQNVVTVSQPRREYKGIPAYDSVYNRIYLSWADSDGVTINVRTNISFAYLNLSDLNMYLMDGTNLGTTILGNVELNQSVIYLSPSPQNTNLTELPMVKLDSKKNPHILFDASIAPWKTITSAAYHMAWNGSAWSTPAKITDVGMIVNTPDYYINPDDTMVAYIVTQGFLNDTANPPYGYGGNIEEWTYNGSWYYIKTIASNMSGQFFFPTIPVNRNGVDVVFAEVESDYYASGYLRIYAYNNSVSNSNVLYEIKSWNNPTFSSAHSNRDNDLIKLNESINDYTHSWKFDSGWGNFVYDSNHSQKFWGTLNITNKTNILGNKIGWNTTGCIYGSCIDFNGSKGYINISQPVSSAASGATVARIKSNGVYSWDMSIAAGTNTGLNSGSRHMLFARNIGECADSSWGTIVANGTASQTACSGQVWNSTNFPVDSWKMLAVVYNGTTISFYNNGILINTTTQTVSAAGNTQRYMIGRLGGYGGMYYNGSIDEVSLWDRELNATEISTLYNSPYVTNGNVSFTSINAGNSKHINRVRVNFSNGDSSHNVTINLNQTGSSTITTIQSNAVSGTWYNIPTSSQFATTDIQLHLRGNSTQTVFIQSLEYTTTPNTIGITKVTYLTRGSVGNKVITNETMANAIWSGTTLSGGLTGNNWIIDGTVNGSNMWSTNSQMISIGVLIGVIVVIIGILVFISEALELGRGKGGAGL